MTTYDNINERPKRGEKSPEEIARKQAWREKRATEMIHRNPKRSPVYKLEKQTAGHLLDRLTALQAETDSIYRCIKRLNHLDDITNEDMCYQDSAFIGTPIEDEFCTLRSRLVYLLERQFEQIIYWRDAVEEELSKRTGEQDWRRAEGRDLDF